MLTRLLQLTSPALPVGAYAYSQGLETAVDGQFIDDANSTKVWIEGILMESLARLDLPAISLFHEAWRNESHERLNALNDRILALRETRELWQEDKQMGQSLARVLDGLGVDGAKVVDTPTFISQFARAGYYWDIPLDELTTGFVWSWLENQVSIATKLIPLGQSDSQAVLFDLGESVDNLVTSVINNPISDDELGQSLPGLAILSCQHEIQHSRLFRS